ncbi:MAG: class I SAM-dependent methyltransferase [Puniceicoccales bacterium]|jgi:tRNA G10  N-methylase Trm11|nr:class I SAM-dependent methyltransferase [Puniceicoccales bacterium]
MDHHFTPKNLDTYLGLCAEVYDLSKPNPPEDAYRFYRNYAKAARGSILEPMCGTGRFLIPLLEEGANIHGFDASHHMLAKLREKAKVKNLTPNVWHDFTQNSIFSEKYDLIFIPSGSFGLLTNEAEALATLRNLYNNLTETGIFVLEVETLKSVPKLGNWQISTWLKSDGTSIRLSQLATFDIDICKIFGKYEQIANNQIIHTETETYNIRIYEQSTIIAALQSTGFRQIRLLKTFDRNQKPSEADESFVCECKK